MTTHASEDAHDDLDVLLLMANQLIRPTSISGEPQAMHGTILSIVASRLSRCLNGLKRREPTRSDIDPILDTLKPYLNYSRSPYSSLNEIQSWATTPGPSLRAALRSTMQSLVLWSSAPTLNMAPPSYTHRQIFNAQVIMGARNTLRCILDEVKSQTEAGSGSVALDIATSLVCAPSQRDSPVTVDWPRSPPPATNSANSTEAPPPARQPSHPRTRLNLRGALKLELEDAGALFSADAGLAESTVRLNRLVEAHLTEMAAAATAADVAAADGMQGILGDGVDMAMADAVADAAAAESLGMGGLGDGAGGMDVTGTGAGSTSTGLDGMEGLLGMGDASGLGDAGLGDGSMDLGVMPGGDDDDIFGDLQLEF
jgi:mediator of RNA polymerase II transcription subunit 5